MRQRLIALGVFAVIVVVLIVLLLTVFKEGIDIAAEEAEDLGPTSSFLLDQMPDDAVTTFTVTQNTTGESVEVTLHDEGWVVDSAPEGADTGLPVDTFRLENASATLLSLSAIRTLEDVSDLAQYGLDSPAYTITFQTLLGRGQTVYVGNLNPGGTMYYVQVEGDDRVFLLNQFGINSVMGLVDEPPFATPTPEPTAGP
jgi:hypothetical protein